MKIIKLVFIFVFGATVPSCSSATDLIASETVDSPSDQSVEITLVIDKAYPPMMYEEDGQVKGLLVELVQAVDEVLDTYDIKIAAVSWSLAKSKIRHGEVLAILGPYFHAYELSMMYPYSYPLFEESVVTVCNVASPNLSTKFENLQNVSWPQDYAGIKMGNVAGFPGWSPKGIKLRDITTMNFFEFPNTRLALNGILNDIVDCSVFERNLLEYFRQEAKQSNNSVPFDNLRIVSDINQQTVHIAYSQAYLRENKRPEIQSFPKYFDEAFITLNRNGDLDAIYEKYRNDNPLLNE